MAKRKLTESQRQSIRNDLKKALAGGASNPEALKQVGKKYGVHPESVRWYLKELTGGKPGRKKKPGRPAASQKPGPKPGRKAKAGRKRGRKPGRPPGRPAAGRPRGRRPGRPKGIGPSVLLRKAHEAARDKARKATALMRIVPDYRKIQKEETGIREELQEVRATERTLARDLKKTTRNRQVMEEKLKGLLI